MTNSNLQYLVMSRGVAGRQVSSGLSWLARAAPSIIITTSRLEPRILQAVGLDCLRAYPVWADKEAGLHNHFYTQTRTSLGSIF